MSLRLKFVIALVALASAASVVIGLTSYRSTRSQLFGAVDQSLDTAAESLPRLARCGLADNQGPGPDDGRDRTLSGLSIQVVEASGAIVAQCDAGLTVTAGDREVAAAGQGRVRHNATAQDEEYRVLTVGRRLAGGQRVGVQFARPLTETNTSLERIARRTLLSVLFVIGAAALAGWWIAHQVTRRLEALTTAASGVAATGALELDVPDDGRDEVGTLARALRGMLGALGASRAAQQQLVQDAGHELRTPLTSLRTNVAVLRQYDRLTDQQRQQILDDLNSETRELTNLVNELVDLATDRAPDEATEQVVLADIVERVAERTRRRSGRSIVVVADDTVAAVRPSNIERAVSNLVDNAVKFAPEGPIEVTAHRGTITVRDHGPGLAAGDEGKVFERFYRAVTSRSLPGSGLGLSIVKFVAEAHGGTAFAGNVPGGGAAIGFSVPRADAAGGD